MKCLSRNYCILFLCRGHAHIMLIHRKNGSISEHRRRHIFMQSNFLPKSKILEIKNSTLDIFHLITSFSTNVLLIYLQSIIKLFGITVLRHHRASKLFLFDFIYKPIRKQDFTTMYSKNSCCIYA